VCWQPGLQTFDLLAQQRQSLVDDSIRSTGPDVVHQPLELGLDANQACLQIRVASLRDDRALLGLPGLLRNPALGLPLTLYKQLHRLDEQALVFPQISTRQVGSHRCGF
jgi:hypothetical protein